MTFGVLNTTSLEDEHTIYTELREPGDTAWLISCGTLVLTMQGGFALLESGSVRLNNTVNILVKNTFDLLLGGVAYWSLGWGLAYGKSWGGFIGTSDFFPDKDLDHTMWFFQLSFAATASTIDSGACAERMRLFVYFGLSFFMTLFTYPVVCHWVWHSEGWLYTMGYVDLAGVSVVHLLGGGSALVCSLMLGPRMGKLGYPIPEELECVKKQLELSHKVFAGEPVHVLFGSMLLFFGWFGFNAGSTLGLTNGGHVAAGRVVFTTMIGASFGGCVGSIVGYARSKILKPGTIACAVLAGLVAVTGGAHVMTGTEAAFSGALGSAFAILSIDVLQKLKIDDAVGVLPVHFVAAFVGNFCTGLFAHNTESFDVVIGVNEIDGSPLFNGGLTLEGPFYGGGFKLVAVQLLGSIVICAWSIFLTYAYLKLLLLSGVEIRVNPLEEMVGLDVIEHATDKFKQFKHMTDMQIMMARLNPSRAKTLSEHITSTILSQADGDMSKSNKQRGKGKGSRIAPTEQGEHRRVKRMHSKVQSTMVNLAKGDNVEALSFLSADLSNLKDEDDDEAILRSTVLSESGDPTTTSGNTVDVLASGDSSG
ncbi:Ammonium transporter [Hondaea fermentalgiana]|uniref:Ammonium transporter n=1 Tax=Hondaea fermentalgiana TaxID=2315210 RepID=A0A2R5FZ34_9STRA|nr:Ammonium transporter [Hondaea fermentalgiana]|eukprot:GBG24012.1 Ammonium transporter [Hondaea fermentalgiana]